MALTNHTLHNDELKCTVQEEGRVGLEETGDGWQENTKYNIIEHIFIQNNDHHASVNNAADVAKTAWILFQVVKLHD